MDFLPADFSWGAFIFDKGVDLVIVLVSLYFGFRLGVGHEKKRTKMEETKRRDELLRELLKSFETNLKYLDQIAIRHTPKGEVPTFNLDTTWLHFFICNVALLVPELDRSREDFNTLRFELDHINRKINLAQVHSFPFTQSDVLPHVQSAKGWILKEHAILTKFLKEKEGK